MERTVKDFPFHWIVFYNGFLRRDRYQLGNGEVPLFEDFQHGLTDKASLRRRQPFHWESSKVLIRMNAGYCFTPRVCGCDPTRAVRISQGQIKQPYRMRKPAGLHFSTFPSTAHAQWQG